MAKSRQDKEYLDMAEQSKVSRFQTTMRVVWLDFFWSSKRTETVSDPPDPSTHLKKNQTSGRSFKFDAIALVSVTVSFQSLREGEGASIRNGAFLERAVYFNLYTTLGAV